MTVVELLRAHLGAPAIVEQTGGGCEALVVALDGGKHLVVSAYLAVPDWGDEGTSVGLYGPGAWEDSGTDAESDAWTDLPLTPALLRSLVDTVLGPFRVHASYTASTL